MLELWKNPIRSAEENLAIADGEITRLRQHLKMYEAECSGLREAGFENAQDLFTSYEGLRQQLATLTEQRDALLRSADYWKAEHLAGNEIIKKLTEQRDMAVSALSDLELCANTLVFCYHRNHGNFAGALISLEGCAKQARSTIAAIQSSEVKG